MLLCPQKRLERSRGGLGEKLTAFDARREGGTILGTTYIYYVQHGTTAWTAKSNDFDNSVNLKINAWQAPLNFGTVAVWTGK